MLPPQLIAGQAFFKCRNQPVAAALFFWANKRAPKGSAKSKGRLTGKLTYTGSVSNILILKKINLTKG
jgi:hypothetical protein